MVMERNKATRHLWRSSKHLFDFRSSPQFNNSVHRSVSGSTHYSTGICKLLRPCIEYKNWSLYTCLHPLTRHGEKYRASMENGLGNTCRIQGRYFGSVTPKKNPAFSVLNLDAIKYFKGLLGEKNVVQEEDRLEDANTDWMRKFKGSSRSNSWIL